MSRRPDAAYEDLAMSDSPSYERARMVPPTRFDTLILFALRPLHLLLLAVGLLAAFRLGGALFGAIALATDVAFWKLFARSLLGHQWLTKRGAELARRRLINRMDVDHRRELYRLEEVATHVRELATTRQAAAQLDALITTYVELAAGCSERRKLLAHAVVPAPQLPAATAAQPRSVRIEALHTSRAELAALHKDLVQQSRAGVEELEQQLALIADAVRLIHQHAIANGCSLDVGTLVDEVQQLAANLRQAADCHASVQNEIEVLMQPKLAE